MMKRVHFNTYISVMEIPPYKDPIISALKNIRINLYYMTQTIYQPLKTKVLKFMHDNNDVFYKKHTFFTKEEEYIIYLCLNDMLKEKQRIKNKPHVADVEMTQV